MLLEIAGIHRSGGGQWPAPARSIPSPRQRLVATFPLPLRLGATSRI
jgi:hypothetical protein